jgi:transposase
MLSFPIQAPIYLYAGVCDMRKSFNGLLGLIHQAEMDDPLSGAWFVFRNRHGDKLKIIYFEGDGLAIWYKRLEQGRFQWPPITAGQASASISASQLRLILEGIDLTSVRRRKRYSPPSATTRGSTTARSRG